MSEHQPLQERAALKVALEWQQVLPAMPLESRLPAALLKVSP